MDILASAFAFRFRVGFDKPPAIITLPEGYSAFLTYIMILFEFRNPFEISLVDSFPRKDFVSVNLLSEAVAGEFYDAWVARGG